MEKNLREGMSMKLKLFITLAGLIMFSLLSLWAGKQQAFAQVPPDILLEDTKPQPPVTFSHKSHATEKKIQCPDCHMNPKLFEMKKGAAKGKMKMAALNKGESCGSCHNGTKAFATKEAKDCAKCHVKK